MGDPIPLRGTLPQDGVATRLRSLVFDGAPAPCKFIDERALAAAWQVSRTPPRVAASICEHRVLMDAFVQHDAGRAGCAECAERVTHDHPMAPLAALKKLRRAARALRATRPVTARAAPARAAAPRTAAPRTKATTGTRHAR